MDWLKQLLENATVTDGKIDVDSLMKAVQAEFPKHAVPKEDFNAKVSELKEANKTIDGLKEATKGNEDLQGQISQYKEQVKTLQAQAETSAKTYALKDALAKEGVRDPEYLIYKAGGIDKFTFTDGKPDKLADTIKPYREDKDLAFLFNKPAGYDPAGGGTGGARNPFAKETFNLTEQGKMFRENPAQAREMAAAAGTKI